VRVLAKIPSRSAPGMRAGTLRRSDLAAYGDLLEKLAGVRAVLVAGEGIPSRAGAIGLAAAAAAAGTRTALLECELAAPSLAEELGLATAPGLHEYLLGSVGAERVLKPLVLAGPGAAEAKEPLVCVVGGRPAPGSAALLASERFRDAVAGLRDAYELLVLVAPAPAPDPAALAAVAAEVDTVLAWTDAAASPPDLPVSVAGLVVQG
jgi:Mrp family chromosome partitioning ATPase